jgi:hypothetical protein
LSNMFRQWLQPEQLEELKLPFHILIFLSRLTSGNITLNILLNCQ